MANLSEWTPRPIEDPHWLVVRRSYKAPAAVISLRAKKMEFLALPTGMDQGIRTRRSATWFSACFDMPQGQE